MHMAITRLSGPLNPQHIPLVTSKSVTCLACQSVTQSSVGKLSLVSIYCHAYNRLYGSLTTPSFAMTQVSLTLGTHCMG